MNFDKESISEDFFFFFGRGGGGGGGRSVVICLFFVFILYIKFQVPGSSGSLVLTQTKGVTDRKRT